MAHFLDCGRGICSIGLGRFWCPLQIRRVTYSTKGKATIYGVGFYRSERHTLLIRRFR